MRTSTATVGIRCRTIQNRQGRPTLNLDDTIVTEDSLADVIIRMSLFDEEQIIKSFIKSERHDEARETAERMVKMGKLSLEEIGLCVPSLSLEELKELEAKKSF